MLSVLLTIVSCAVFVGAGLFYYRLKDRKHVPSSKTDEEIARNWPKPK